MKSTILASLIRTIVPLVVGTVVTVLAKANITGLEDVATQAVTIVVTTLYYAGVRLAETKLGPAWGWLVGYANAPVYTAPTPAVATTLAPVFDAETAD